MVSAMAIITVKTKVQVCDICADSKTEAIDRVRLGLNGKWINMDLCGRHAAAVNSKLREWGVGDGRGPSATAGSTTEVRNWARANGHTVSDRGRIAGPIIAAFVASQSSDSNPEAPVSQKPTSAVKRAPAKKKATARKKAAATA